MVMFRICLEKLLIMKENLKGGEAILLSEASHQLRIHTTANKHNE